MEKMKWPLELSKITRIIPATIYLSEFSVQPIQKTLISSPAIAFLPDSDYPSAGRARPHTSNHVGQWIHFSYICIPLQEGNANIHATDQCSFSDITRGKKTKKNNFAPHILPGQVGLQYSNPTAAWRILRFITYNEKSTWSWSQTWRRKDLCLKGCLTSLYSWADKYHWKKNPASPRMIQPWEEAVPRPQRQQRVKEGAVLLAEPWRKSTRV